MTTFADMIDFLGFYKEDKGLSVESLADTFNLDIDNVLSRIKQFKIIESLKELIKKNPSITIKDLSEEAQLPKGTVSPFISMLEVLYPGSVKYNQLANKKQVRSFKKIKLEIATNTLLADGRTDSEIAGILKIKPERVYILKKNLPANITVQTNDVRKQRRIEEFFSIYPYSTAKDASIALRMTVREIKLFIEALEKQGKVIKVNNVPRPLEAEELKVKILELKNENPAISNKDISMQLNVPITLVAAAISEAIRILQLEKAESYEFYTARTLGDLGEIKKEAWERHRASPASSSRWMELVLMATEKEISILGLKAPERININKNVNISKKERDSIVAAYMESEVYDAEYEHIEVTGTEDEN